jgi:hypothetical protein
LCALTTRQFGGQDRRSLNSEIKPAAGELVRFVTIALMPTEHIIALLIAERDKLNRAIAALQETATIHTSIAEATAPKSGLAKLASAMGRALQ